MCDSCREAKTCTQCSGTAVRGDVLCEACLTEERWSIVTRELELKVAALDASLSAEKARTDIQRGVAEKWKGLFEERSKLWQEAEKKLESIGELLSANGCDCECDHSAEEHDDDCERCLGCMIGGVLESRAKFGGGK